MNAVQAVEKLCPTLQFWTLQTGGKSYGVVDDDASPQVLETMEAAANIHVDDTITPDGGKLLLMGQGYASASNTPPQLEQWSSCILCDADTNMLYPSTSS